MKDIKVDVPCNGCTYCCQNDAVRIQPFEDASQWKTEPHPFFPDQLMLAHKKNRDCYYLGEGGCTIQDTKPYMCRTGDCRIVAVKFTIKEAQANKYIPVKLWRKGKELLNAMEKKERKEFIKMVNANG